MGSHPSLGLDGDVLLAVSPAKHESPQQKGWACGTTCAWAHGIARRGLMGHSTWHGRGGAGFRESRSA